MQSPAYMNKNSDVYAMVEKYLKMLYPGALTQDATGRLTPPEYDMTLKQFNEAQAELDAALEEAITEAKAKYEETGQEIDVEDYVELKETIDVKVLMPDGRIANKQLEVYSLELPDGDDDTPNNKPRRVWRWHSEAGDNTCDECASRNGKIYYSENDIPELPTHPNCRCTITEDLIGPDGRMLSSKPYSSKKTAPASENAAAVKQENAKKMTKDEKFEEAYNKLKEPEGGYTDGTNQVRDEPTNMGIKQSTLDDYATKHPERGLPSDVKDLEPSQAKEIYKEVYWTKTNIPGIEDDRVRNAVFDMNVMGGAGRVVQRALNDFSDAKLAVDGKIGQKTVDALNSIPKGKIPDFMEKLKEKRIEYLQQTTNWSTAKGGWTKRTNNY